MRLKIVCKLLPDASGGYRGFVSIRKTFRLWRFPKVIHFALDHGPIASSLTFKVRPDDESIYAGMWFATRSIRTTGLPFLDRRMLRYEERKNALLAVAYDAIRKAIVLSIKTKASKTAFDPMNEGVWRVRYDNHSARHALRNALRPGGLP